MSAFIEDEERRIVPRWRDSRTTIALGQLTPIPLKVQSGEPTEDFLANKLHDWASNHTVPFAADVVSSAFVLRRGKEAAEAAKFILAHSRLAPAPAIRLARMVLGLEEDDAEAGQVSTDLAHGVEGSRKAVRVLRASLRDAPRDPLAWVDLARHYSILGCRDQALEAMRLGVNLAPNDRFTLRSAARLQVHVGDPERGLAILNRSGATRRDPWLLAAEIAVSAVAGRTSRQIKSARALLQSDAHSPAQTSELASALATQELMAGDTREARRLFRQALVAPTDNSVAQAEWASRRWHTVDLEKRHLEVPRSYEARAWQRFSLGDWKAALKESLEWLDDEPFSSRPAVFGSFVAAVELEDYKSSEQLAKRGLQSEPGHLTLLNNLAFALASSGRVDEASAVYEEIATADMDATTRVAWLATGGLLRFRSGMTEEGRGLYQRAMELASESSLVYQRALAAAFLAREELLARTPYAISALENARHEVGKVQVKAESLSVKAVVDRIDNLARKRTSGSR